GAEELKEFAKRLKRNNDLIISEIRRRLTDSLNDIDNFLRILQGIDISVYAWDLTKRLKFGDNARYYYRKILVSGDDVSKVEVTKYQCAYTISFTENGTRYTVPPIYQREEFHFTV